MRLRFLVPFFLLAAIHPCHAQQQQSNFCEAISTIAADAPNKFRNIRGATIGANQNATMWACGIKVPGTISSRFVYSMGLFYEGALFQSKNKEELKAQYDKYKQLLEQCLPEYKESKQSNFYPGLADYKKLVFLPDVKENEKAPASAPGHFALEATCSKEVGFYTLVLYIFEH